MQTIYSYVSFSFGGVTLYTFMSKNCEHFTLNVNRMHYFFYLFYRMHTEEERPRPKELSHA